MAECPFCRIVAGDLPAAIVHRDDDCVAFRDLEPRAPVHVLLVPRRHLSSLAAATGDDAALLGRLLAAAAQVARAEGLEGAGYRVVVNCGADGGQSVDHLHVHLLGGRRLGWPPG